MPATKSTEARKTMKKILSIVLCLALVMSLGLTAYAEEISGEDAAPEDEVEEAVDATAEEPADLVDATGEEPEEDAGLGLGADEDEILAAQAAEAEAAAAEEEATQEEQSSVNRGLPGSVKTLIVAVILLVLGAGVIALGNHKTKGPKKPADKKKD